MTGDWSMWVDRSWFRNILQLSRALCFMKICRWAQFAVLNTAFANHRALRSTAVIQPFLGVLFTFCVAFIIVNTCYFPILWLPLYRVWLEVVTLCRRLLCKMYHTLAPHSVLNCITDFIISFRPTCNVIGYWFFPIFLNSTTSVREPA